MGAEYDHRAPWNETTPDDRLFDCEVMETVSRKVKVATDNYNEYSERDEDGMYFSELDTNGVDWDEEYTEQYDSLPALFLKVKDFLTEHVDIDTLDGKGRELYNSILPQCEGWQLVERDIDEI